jgi:hypothetical protein
MSKKTAARSKASKKLQSFNRSQEIYKLLEKGIIESEALMNSSVDRPEDDAHIVELFESASQERTQDKGTPPRSKPAGSAKRAGRKK